MLEMNSNDLEKNWIKEVCFLFVSSFKSTFVFPTEWVKVLKVAVLVFSSRTLWSDRPIDTVSLMLKAQTRGQWMWKKESRTDRWPGAGMLSADIPAPLRTAKIAKYLRNPTVPVRRWRPTTRTPGSPTAIGLKKWYTRKWTSTADRVCSPQFHVKVRLGREEAGH